MVSEGAGVDPETVMIVNPTTENGRIDFKEELQRETPKIGVKKSTQTFLYNLFEQPFGSWASAPKIVDVRTKKCVFLRPRWWGETFDPWASGRKGQECPRDIRTKKFMFMLFFRFPEKS